ncbi:class I SAM-dependent methyltransferase [Candidatus Woesearchaeota archaeon]|nr:class I SAM-dependent methyltransferase [Candidatus Woesearchaeota archaeon]
MDKKIYETLYKTEENYWWFVGQRFILKSYLEKYYHSKKDLLILDVGCGTGINLKLLSKFGTACGIDVSEDALDFCRARGLNNVKKSDVMDLKFKSNTFDVVTSLGVFYHKKVTDDLKGFREIYRVLKPRGRLFFMDPAMKCLFGKHDIAFQGIRRYSKRELKLKLEKAGFIVEDISYFNTLLFPFVYVNRKFGNMSKSQPKSDVNENINPFLNSILKMVYIAELSGLQYMNYPFGVNILAVGKKK